VSKKKIHSKKLLPYILFVGIFIFGLLIGSFLQKHEDKKKLTPSVTSNQTLKEEPKYTHEIIVKELGIKFKVPEGLSDLVYAYKDNPPSATFSTKSLMNLDKNCGPEAGPFGGIVKYNKTGPFPFDGNEETVKEATYSRLDEGYSNQIVGPRAKEFDTFYIMYFSPQSPCSFPLEGQAAKLEGQQFGLLRGFIPTVELIK